MNPDSNVQTETSNSTVVIPKSTVTKPENPSQYIRTYAKDVAKLSGQSTPSPTLALGKQPLSFTLPPKPDISLKEQDSSAVESAKVGEKMNSPMAVLVTTKEDGRGIFEEQKKVENPPLTKDTITESFSVPVTESVPIVSATTMGGGGSETRDGILARLRAKINATQAAAPLEKRSGEMNLLQRQADLGKELPAIATREDVAPSSEPFEFPVTLPQPKPAPVAEFHPLTPPSNPITLPASPLHTYSTDFADRIDERKATVFSVMAAEQDAIPSGRVVTVKNEISTSSKLRLAFAILLLIGSVGIVTVGYQFFTKSSLLPVIAPTIPSVIAYDSVVEITSIGSGLMEAIAEKTKMEQPQGNIRIPYITVSSSTKLGTVQTPQQGAVLIENLSINAPEILLRNTSKESTLGIIHAGDENRVFFIFDVTSYERTFAGMLAWEPSILSDLALLYPAYATASVTPEPLAVSTNGKKSVVKVPTPTTPRAAPPVGFIDAVVANHDVREYKDSNNRTMLLYGYTNKKTLIIARNEAAFSAIVARLSAGSTK